MIREEHTLSDILRHCVNEVGIDEVNVLVSEMTAEIDIKNNLIKEEVEYSEEYLRNVIAKVSENLLEKTGVQISHLHVEFDSVDEADRELLTVSKIILRTTKG